MQLVIKNEVGPILPCGRHKEDAFARPCRLRIDGFDDFQRISNIRPSPARAGISDLEVAAWRGLAAYDLDAAVTHAEELARLMLGQHAGDVIVHHHHLVNVALPLLGENANSGGAAADTHALFLHTVDDRRPTRLHENL